MVITKEKTKSFEKTENSKKYQLILWNDDENSADYVVDSIIDIIEIDFENAYEIMSEAHNNGKALVFSSDLDNVIFKHNRFTDRKINTTIAEF